MSNLLIFIFDISLIITSIHLIIKVTSLVWEMIARGFEGNEKACRCLGR